MGAAGALLLATPSAIVYGREIPTKADAPWHLLPFMLFEDVARLAAQSPELDDKYKQAIIGNLHHPAEGNLARLAWSQKDNKTLAGELLDQIFKNDNTPLPRWKMEKTSFVIGWLIFNAVMAVFDKELIKFSSPAHQIGTIKIYQEAHLIASRYGTGADLSKSQPGDVSDALRAMLARAITRVHTLTPDATDGGDWAIRTSQWRAQNKILMDIYDDAIFKPDAQKYQKYCQDVNLFSTSDALIKSNYTFGTHLATNNSLYAKAIIKGYKALLDFQAYTYGLTSKRPIA